ncbi:MAG: NusG domain II-containing protein [Lachnospiraceae bacterium]|nr:NusG domain II-containing protein [Lachnospiraceae bacterium]
MANIENNKKLNSRIIVASVVCAVIFISSLLAVFLRKNQISGQTAYIYSSGRLVRTIDLNIAPNESFDITSENGGSNTIEISNHNIRVTHASCPDGLCVKCGYARESGIPIVCLPNKLVIVLDDNKGGSVDAVTY